MMQRPIEIDRLTATMGYAAVPASYLLHAIRAGERFGLDPREIIVELGQAQGRRRPGGRDHRDRGRDGGDSGTHCDDHGRPRRRPDRHAGDERRPGRARLVGRRGLARAVRAGDRAVHVLTNSRAHSPAEARGLIASAAARRPRGVPRRPAWCCAATARCARTCGRSTTRCAAVVSPERARRAAAARAGASRPPVASPSAASTCSSATASACRSIARSTPRDGALAYSRRAPAPLGGGALRRPLRRGRRGRRSRSHACGDRPAPPTVAAAIGSAGESGRPVAVSRMPRRATTSRRSPRGLRAAEDAGSPVIVRCSPAFVAALTGSARRTARRSQR